MGQGQAFHLADWTWPSVSFIVPGVFPRPWSHLVSIAWSPVVEGLDNSCILIASYWLRITTGI